jgi:hypothetical protein
MISEKEVGKNDRQRKQRKSDRSRNLPLWTVTVSLSSSEKLESTDLNIIPTDR